MVKGPVVRTGGRPPSKMRKGGIGGKPALTNKPMMRSAHSDMPKAFPLSPALGKKLKDHPAQAGHIRDLQARKERNR
jgi:hypothetical protein